MWDIPGPGIEPVSPALQGRFLTMGPPGKPHLELFLVFRYYFNSKKKAQKPTGWIKPESLESPSLAGGFFTTRLPGIPLALSPPHTHTILSRGFSL